MTNETTNENSIKTNKKLTQSVHPQSSYRFHATMVILMIGVLSLTAYTHFSTQQASKKWTALFNQLQQNQLKTSHLLQTEHINFEANQRHFQTDIKALEKQFRIAITPSTDVSNQWLLLKAQYAIQLAQLNAKWSWDEATTDALLKQADVFLSEHPNVNLISVRQALSRDMLARTTMPRVDFIGLLSQIDAIQQHLITCPDNPSNTKQNAITTDASPKSIQISWRTSLHNTLNTLKQFFIVQHHTDPMQPILTPAYRTLQKEIIRLNLQEAQWAILQHNTAIYQLTLKQACDNMRRTFGKNNTKAQQLIQQIEQLQNIEIQDVQFVPKESLVALEQIIEAQTTKKSSSPALEPIDMQQTPLSFGLTP